MGPRQRHSLGAMGLSVLDYGGAVGVRLKRGCLRYRPFDVCFGAFILHVIFAREKA
jgi:hypothetical protein